MRKGQTFCSRVSRRGHRAHRAHRDLRCAAPPRPHHDLLEPRARPRCRSWPGCPRTCASCSRCTRARRSRWRPATRSAAARRRWRCCTRRRGSATRSPRSPPRAPNRAPLVVIVGQQDRRHLAQDPFLAGRLHGLAGDYPVWVDQPVRAQDVPGAITRAYHEAATGRGPAIVIVPMDDWSAPGARAARDPRPGHAAALDRRRRGRRSTRSRTCSSAADAPAIVAGAGADGAAGWAALVALAERLGCPVWQEPFGGQAGFPQDHPRFAGHLPARRARLREVLSPHDALLVVGAGAFRQYPYDEGRWSSRHARSRSSPRIPRRRTAARSTSPCSASRPRSAPRWPRPSTRAPRPPGRPASARPHRRRRRRASRCAPAMCSPRWPSACRTTRSCSRRRPRAAPSCTRASRRPSRRLHQRDGDARLRGAAAIGVRIAREDRPVLAVVGDGSSLYQITALWTAATYGVGVLFVVLVNGGYAIMDRLAERNGADGPWPAARRDRHRRDGARPGLPDRARRRPRRTCSSASTRCCRRSRPQRAGPARGVVAPDATFDP